MSFTRHIFHFLQAQPRRRPSTAPIDYHQGPWSMRTPIDHILVLTVGEQGETLRINSLDQRLQLTILDRKKQT